MTLQDLSIKHDYYCADSNYFSYESSKYWDNWSDFYNEYKDCDIDLNLIFRWDIVQYENASTYYMKIFVIHQRKGIFAPHTIRLIEESDVIEIINILRAHYRKLISIWNPVSKFKYNL